MKYMYTPLHLLRSSQVCDFGTKLALRILAAAGGGQPGAAQLHAAGDQPWPASTLLHTAGDQPWPASYGG